MCGILTASSNFFFFFLMKSFCWHWSGCWDARRQQRHASSFCVGLANGTKQMPSQNWGTYYQSCMYPTNSAWPAFLMSFLLLLPVSGHLSHGFTVSPTKHAYSARHLQALTECSPLNFQRSSIITINQPTHKPHKHESPHTVIQSIHL